MLALFTAILIALAGLLALLAGATILCKAWRYWSEHRRVRLETALRPKLFAFLAEDAPDPTHFLPDSRRELRVWELLAAGLLTKLRGEDRRALTGLLEANGALDRARARTRHRSPVWRARAAELLGASGLDAALPDLRRLLRDRDRDVRAAAVRAIGKLGCPGGRT
jgi:HEAT repeats